MVRLLVQLKFIQNGSRIDRTLLKKLVSPTMMQNPEQRYLPESGGQAPVSFQELSKGKLQRMQCQRYYK